MKKLSFFVSLVLFMITSSYLSLVSIISSDFQNLEEIEENEIVNIEGNVSKITQRNNFCQLIIEKIETRISGNCPYFELQKVNIRGYKKSFMNSSWVQILEIKW